MARSFEARDEALATIADPALDFSRDSLVVLEMMYFDLHGRRAFRKTSFHRRDAFERMMGFYVGEVAVRAKRAKWVVGPGDEVGIEWNRGLSAVLGIDGLCEDWFKRKNNVRRRALSRWYDEMFPRRA